MFDSCGTSDYLSTRDHAFAYLRSAPIKDPTFESLWGYMGAGFDHVVLAGRSSQVVDCF